MKLLEVRNKLETAFNDKQSEILTEIIYHASYIRETDFNELKSLVKDILISQSIAQQESDKRMLKVEQTLVELTEAHKQSEQRLTRVEQTLVELTDAQKQSEQRLTRVELGLVELTDAQKRTEIKVEQLAQALKRTDDKVEQLRGDMEAGFKAIRNQIVELGSRWGIRTEAMFRAAIRGLLSRQENIQVTKGYYGNREVDVIIRNGEHILLEISSRIKWYDIANLIESAKDYENKHHVEPKLMIASSYIAKALQERISKLPKPIEIFTYEEEDLDEA
jgi:hypothetical protein